MRVSLLLLSIAVTASANQLVIREVESLRNSLPLRDGARKELTLRLADLYFDEAIGKGGETLDDSTREKDQKRAAMLYEETLSGNDGVYQPVGGNVRRKVQFQLARIYADLGLAAKAEMLWKGLVEQSDLPDLQREAALRLAEVREKQDTPAARAEADKLYQLGIRLCAGGDVCSYAHYRRAWLLKTSGDLTPAIAEMQAALWDSKGQVREESLRDLVLFLSAVPADGKAAVETMEPLVAKLGRPQLMVDLAEGFYTAGNRVAGTFVLGYVNQRTPRLAYQVRLLEEYYGARSWDRFKQTMEQARTAQARLEGKEREESEKVLRRLMIQLDGERITQKDHAIDFKDATELYLSLYPESKDRLKMIEGWMAAESEPQKKIDKLAGWIVDPRWQLSKDEVIHLREFRSAVAAKAKLPTVVAEEMAKLVELAATPAKAREYRYVRANALFELKSAEALAAFQALADPAAPFDEIRIHSQHTAMGLLVDAKDYAGLISQADKWLTSEAARKETKVAGDLQRMRATREQAQFEQAVAAGKTAPALATFQSFCEQKKYLPKSCENAKVIAVALKNQPALFAVLKATGSQNELQAEYEAAGFFSDAAVLAEKKLDAKADITAQLKVALLHELGGRIADRDRILRGLVKSLKGKSPGVAEDLLRQTLADAGLLDATSLTIAWKPENVARIAEALEAKGQGSEQTRKLLLAQATSSGPAWGRRVLAEVEQLDTAQKKIHFYGKRSSRKFEARIAAIKKLGKEVQKYLPGADRAMRVRLLGILIRSQRDLNSEIINTPIPAQVTGSEAEAVKASLAQLAQPYADEAGKLEGVARDEIAKAADPTEKASLENELAGRAVIAAAMPSPATAAPAPVAKPADIAAAELRSDPATLKAALDALHSDPGAATALAAIKNFYEGRGQLRLAAYFQGRLQQLGGQTSEPKETVTQ